MRPLVGRGAEREALRRVVADAVTERRLRAVVVAGAAGMGASALAGAAVADANALGAAVLRARAIPVQRVSPGGVAVAAGWIRNGGTATDVVGAVEDRARGAPAAVVVLEHLHDADRVTVAGLQQVVARLADAPVAIVVTTRDASAPPGDALVADIADAGGAVLTLEPLDDDQCVEIVEHELGARCGPRLRQLVSRAGGVPVAVVELVTGLAHQGRIRIDDDVAEVDGDNVPGSVRDTVLRRLAGVPPRALDVLHVAATMGEVVELVDLALVLGRSVSDVLADVAPERAEPLLEHNGPIAWFRHELMRDALYESMSPAVRAAVHAEIASVLATVGKPPAVVARHVVAAGGAAAPAVAVDAAWALRRDAPTLALDVARAALDASVTDAAVHDRLVTASLWPLVTQGALVDVETSARELLSRRHDPALDAELTWCLVASLQRQGQAASGRDELVRFLAVADLDPADRAFLSARVPIAHVLTGDLDAAAASADELLGTPALARVPDVAVGARVAKIFDEMARGDVVTANRLSAEVAQRLRDDPPTSSEGMGVVVPATLVEADRFDEARLAVADAARADAGRGDPSVVSVYDVWLVVIDALSGAWDDAVAGADAVRQAVADDGGAAVSALYALAYPAVVHLRRGALERAEADVATAERALEASGPQNGADIVLWARALLLEAGGATLDAAALLAMEWDLTARVRYFHSWRSIAPDLVRLALATGDRARATAVTEDAEEGSRRAGDVASARGAALRCRGLLDGDPDVLVAAADVLRDSPRRPDLVLAAEDAGVALAASNRRADAVALLSEARVLADAMSAHRDVRRLDSRLSLLGAAPRRVRRDAAASGWEALTAREAEVAALVAQGLTNPQIADRLVVSRHTVESHLKRIFLKLGAASRAQVAAEALRRANT
jgi:DNA-binding CsgD family transcriptional regulator